MEKRIWLAGGCFWGVEEFFKRVKGVLSTRVGYANGPAGKVSYEEVCAAVGHAETVQIDYDPKAISLDELLELMFVIVDPHSVNRQGNDRGVQYRSGIYGETAHDVAAAAAFLEKKQKLTARKIVVECAPLKNFVLAEEYHQDYLRKNPGGYCHIDMGDLPPDYAKDGF